MDAKNQNKNSSANRTVPGSPLGPAAGNGEQTKTPVEPQKAVEPTTETKDQSTTSEADEKERKRQELKDRLKKKGDSSATKLMDPLARMNLFDSTKASQMDTKGNSQLGSIKPQESGMMIMGRNVGAEQNEPDWTNEQLAYIRNMCDIILPVREVTDTRRSIMDPDMKFVARDEGGSIVPTEEAYVSNLDPSMYCIGTGSPKYDITGSPKHYQDAVIADINGMWMLSQWTSEWVVVEGVAPDVLLKQNRNGASLQNNRRIGVNFARIGLPKLAFGGLFNTLSQNFPGIMANVVETTGYYWMNASWGVSSFSATFAYIDNGNFKKTSNLADVMRMLNGKSSLSLATVAISITSGTKSEGNKQVPDRSSYGLSVKLHNAFGVDIVDYHGPPQQGSTGMMIPSRFIKNAKSMGSSSGVGGSMSIFSSAKPSLFATSSQAPASVKSDDNASYM